MSVGMRQHRGIAGLLKQLLVEISEKPSFFDFGVGVCSPSSTTSTWRGGYWRANSNNWSYKDVYAKSNILLED